MKTRKFLWFVAALPLVMAGLSSCDKTESNEDGGEQTGNTRFRVSVNDETLTAESVTVSVTCTGGSDTWYCFVTDDVESDIDEVIAEELAGITDYQSVLKVGNQSVEFDNLTERTTYRAVVTGLLADGTVVGTPDDDEFTTPLTEGKWIVNENWSCEYKGRGDMTLDESQGTSMYADVLTFTVNGGYDYYLPAVVSVDEFTNDYNSDIAAFAADEIAVVQAEIDARNDMGQNAMWIDYLMDYTMTGSLGVLDSDQKWYAVMLGVDLDGKGTGLYAMSDPITPAEEPATEEYNRWLGTWRIVDIASPAYYYIVEITADENNYQYLVSGWEGENGNQANTDIDFPPFHAQYDKTTYSLSFMSEDALQRVNMKDLDVSIENQALGRADIGFNAFYLANPSDRYFSTITGTYPIATASMDAEGNVTVETEPMEITDSQNNSYTVDLVGMWYSAALIDYKDEAGRGGYSLSFDYRVPRFPYNMVRVDDASQSAVSPASVPASAPVSTKIVKSSRNWSLPRFAK